VTSHTTKRFREAFRSLPEHVQRLAREAYRLFQQDPYRPSLRFRRVHPTRPVYSVRVDGGYRAVGYRDEEDVTWFWIGSHADYDGLISRL